MSLCLKTNRRVTLICEGGPCDESSGQNQESGRDDEYTASCNLDSGVSSLGSRFPATARAAGRFCQQPIKENLLI